MKAVSHFSLEDIQVTVATDTRPEAEVSVYVLKDRASRRARAVGTGPIDALFSAIDAAVGAQHSLDSYSIRSESRGSDALGEVTVLLAYGEALFRGVAKDPNIITASAEAYVDALNHLEAFRAEEESVVFVSRGIIQSFQSHTG